MQAETSTLKEMVLGGRIAHAHTQRASRNENLHSQSTRSLDSQSSLDSLPLRRLAADPQLDSQPGP